VEQFPKTGNSVGLDKLIFDYPYSIELVGKLNLRNRLTAVDGDTGEIKYSSGEMGNGIRVNINANNIRFTLNPTIELFKNNFFTLSKKELRDYLEFKFASLGLDLRLAIIRRIDIQSTLKVFYNPKEYFSLLGNYKSFIRSQISTSLYYKSDSSQKYKVMLFYDKKLKNKGNVPVEFKEGKYLRYEAQYYNRYLKEIAKKLNKRDLSLLDLFDDVVYNKLIDCWFNDYKGIYKQNQLHFDLGGISKPSDIDRYLAVVGIKSLLGVGCVLDMVDSSKLFSNKSSSFFSKVKSRVKVLGQHKNSIKKTPLLDELESLIFQANKRVKPFI
jgi:hypothetical protein